MTLLERGISPLLHHLLDVSKVVILEGGRAVGKTTLAQQIGDERGFRTSFDLSDPADRAALAADPHRVLAASTRPILIDEAQLEPEITVAVKRLVDTSEKAGQVLLTGSTRIGRGALGGSDPLAGRAVRLRLNAFTQGELTGQPSDALERLWSDDPDFAIQDELGLDDLHAMFVAGGLPPLALDSSGSIRLDRSGNHRIIDSYIDGVITTSLAGTRTDRGLLLKTFRYLAANPGQILSLSRAASELSIRFETVRDHLELCTSSFLLDLAEAHRPNEHQTITAHPRVFASDVALATWAANTSEDRLLRDMKLSGSLLENLVANELQAQVGWTIEGARMFHWRDSRNRREVDLVLRRPDGSMLAIEVKSSSSVSLSDAKGLIAFAEAAQGQVVRGLIIHTGRATTRLAENIWGVPLKALFSNSTALTS